MRLKSYDLHLKKCVLWFLHVGWLNTYHFCCVSFYCSFWCRNEGELFQWLNCFEGVKMISCTSRITSAGDCVRGVTNDLGAIYCKVAFFAFTIFQEWSLLPSSSCFECPRKRTFCTLNIYIFLTSHSVVSYRFYTNIYTNAF